MLINGCFATDRCTRVLNRVFRRVPSTQPYEYEYFLSIEGLEYEYVYSKMIFEYYSSTSTECKYSTSDAYVDHSATAYFEQLAEPGVVLSQHITTLSEYFWTWGLKLSHSKTVTEAFDPNN